MEALGLRALPLRGVVRTKTTSVRPSRPRCRCSGAASARQQRRAVVVAADLEYGEGRWLARFVRRLLSFHYLLIAVSACLNFSRLQIGTLSRHLLFKSFPQSRERVITINR